MKELYKELKRIDKQINNIINYGGSLKDVERLYTKQINLINEYLKE